MSKKNLYALWGILYILCAALGFVGEVGGLVKACMILLALAFFAPPAILLYHGVKQNSPRELKRIRNLSALSLLATLVVMILNLLCAVDGSEALGNTMFALLVLVSSPMYCARNGFVSLFLWACLLMVSLRYLKKR